MQIRFNEAIVNVETTDELLNMVSSTENKLGQVERVISYSRTLLMNLDNKSKFRFHPVKFSPPQSKLVSLWNKLVLLQTPPSPPKLDFLVVKSTVLWLVLVRSRVKPQRLMLKKRRRPRPAVPRDVC